MITYVCYRNENVEFMGTAYEVIAHYKWKSGFNTLKWYTTPAARRRGTKNFCIEKVVE